MTQHHYQWENIASEYICRGGAKALNDSEHELIT